MPLLLLFLLCALFFSVLLFRTNERKCFFQQTCTHFDGCIRRLSDSAFSFTLYSILDSIIILIHSIRDLSATHSVHSSSAATPNHTVACFFCTLKIDSLFCQCFVRGVQIFLFFAHFRIQIEISSRNAQIVFVALTQPQQQANINLHTYSFQNETKYEIFIFN